jgi:hypothetical protein
MAWLADSSSSSPMRSLDGGEFPSHELLHLIDSSGEMHLLFLVVLFLWPL